MPRVSIDWEWVLGRNWFAIVGALALAIGIGFFLKLAFDNDWIGHTGRVVLGVVVGMALLGAGEYTQRRFPLWAQPVTGGGITVLYLSIYAGFGLYELIGFVPALLFLTLVVVLSVLLALRYESLVIALLGIVGAFLTPVLLLGVELGPDPIPVLLGVELGLDLAARTDLPDEHWLLLYIVVIDLGVLAVSTFRNWRWFTLVGMVGSYGLFALWMEGFPDRDPVLAQLALSGVFLEFIGATTLFHVLWRRAPGGVDLALMTLNAVGYYGGTFSVLWDRYEAWFGGITLGLSLLYGLVAYLSLRRTAVPPLVALFALAIAVVFLTLAVPLQLTGNWETVAWAAEGAAVVGVGFLLGMWTTRAFGLGVLAVAALHLLIFDTPVALEDFRPVLNLRFPTFVVTIGAFCVAAYLYWRHRQRLEEWERDVALVLGGAANFFTLWLLSAEVIAYFDSRELQARTPFARQDAENGKYLALTALWSFFALGLMVAGVLRRSPLLRWVGLGLLAAPVLKLLLFDTFVVDLDPLTFRPVINFHFLVFLLVLAALLFATYLYRRERGEVAGWEGYAPLALVAVAAFVSLWVFSLESIRFFDFRETKLGTDYADAKQLSLTVLWAVYALGVIGVGIARNVSAVRLAGLTLLAIPVVKLFVYDVFQLEQGYRVASFITLGVLLLGLGLAYQLYSEAFKGFLFGKQS